VPSGLTATPLGRSPTGIGSCNPPTLSGRTCIRWIASGVGNCSHEATPPLACVSTRTSSMHQGLRHSRPTRRIYSTSPVTTLFDTIGIRNQRKRLNTARYLAKYRETPDISTLSSSYAPTSSLVFTGTHPAC